MKKKKSNISVRTSKISSTTEEYDDSDNPIEDIIERLNYCRSDYYKLYKKDFKVASIRLRQNLEYVIQTAKQLKRDALAYRKDIEKRQEDSKKDNGYE
jgi:lipid II:glycine glycyltransferase (peptidoglycan interpeptide bridge formation enzyme)